MWQVLGRAIVSAAGLALLLTYVGIPHGLGATLACLAYVVVGTLLRPEPDLSNVGLLGGLIDHPFRLSDDVNRFLIFLLVFLWPGRVIGGGFLLLGRSLVAALRSAT